MAPGRWTGPAWIRAGFVVAGLLGGLGILVYIACWMILPLEGEAPNGPGSGWVVMLARACLIAVGVLIVAAFGAAATLFGFGWIVIALAAAVLVAGITCWPRFGPAATLLPIAALTLPSLAVAAGGLRLSPETGHATVSPRALVATAPMTVRAGLGTMLIDLRRTSLPPSGAVVLNIEGGVRRTIVALPEDRCVHVELRYRVHPLVAQVAAQLTGVLPFSGLEMFGSVINPGGRTSRFAQGPAAGPWLDIHFDSLGGSLYVRDYPNGIDPDARPSWPGYPVFAESRPDTRGVPRQAARRLIGAWRVRRTEQVRSKRLVDALMRGPCAAAGVAR